MPRVSQYISQFCVQPCRKQNTLRCCGEGGYTGPEGTAGCIGSRSLASDEYGADKLAAAGAAVPLELRVRPVPSATAMAILKTPQTPTAATATAPKAANPSLITIFTCQLLVTQHQFKFRNSHLLLPWLQLLEQLKEEYCLQLLLLAQLQWQVLVAVLCHLSGTSAAVNTTAAHDSAIMFCCSQAKLQRVASPNS